MICYNKLNWVDQRDLSHMVKGPTFLSLTTDLWTVVQTVITGPKSRGTSSFRNANSFVEMGFRLILLLQYGAMGFQQFSYTNWALKKVRECLSVDFYAWFNQSPGKRNQRTPVSVSTRFEKESGAVSLALVESFSSFTTLNCKTFCRNNFIAVCIRLTIIYEKKLLYLFHKTFFFGWHHSHSNAKFGNTFDQVQKDGKISKSICTVGQHKNVPGSFFDEAPQLVFSVTKILEKKKL